MTAAILLTCVIPSQSDELMQSYQKELAKVEQFLATADTIQTVVSDRAQASDGREALYPNDSSQAGRTRPPKQNPQTVKTQNLRGEDRKKVVSYFRTLTKPPIQGPAKCFFPRHSIFARKGSQRIDIQICYECCTMLINTSDTKFKAYLGINRDSRPAADKLFGYVSKNSKA